MDAGLTPSKKVVCGSYVSWFDPIINLDLVMNVVTTGRKGRKKVAVTGEGWRWQWLAKG